MEINGKKPQQSMPENAKKVFDGVIFDVYQWEQEMYDGSMEIFEKLKKKSDTANVIAFTEEGKVIVLEQEQPAKGKFFSLPGGMLEGGETPGEGARRELLEETGYVPRELELWHSIQLISKIDWRIYFFIAKRCKKVSEQKLDNGEKIKVHLVDFEEFVEMIFSEKIKSSEFIMKFFKDGLVSINKGETMEHLKNRFGL